MSENNQEIVNKGRETAIQEAINEINCHTHLKEREWGAILEKHLGDDISSTEEDSILNQMWANGWRLGTDEFSRDEFWREYEAEDQA